MQIVDDRLALKALQGWRSPAWDFETPSISWLAHARLLRALLGSSTTGSLSREAFEGALEAALNPPSDVLQVLDPRPYTADAASLSISHSIPLLPAGMLATAIRHGAAVHVHVRNFMDKWEHIVEGTGAVIHIHGDSETLGSL
ncbi:hypothetical protein [Candidatus Poriferisocius sp.]|uniref:hypothetical protein n=1 Tax=Candidatus Poriferisocius sp. TaxID=3101276 RepID=UPI003B595B2B